MNKQIQELYQKAHREVVEEDIYNGMPSVELRFDPEKFAELIIKECAEQCLTDDSMRILNHMGVKGVE